MMSFPVKETQETVIHSDEMEMASQETSTVFKFLGHVRITSDTFHATTHALTAFLSGNPIEETAIEKESAPRLTQIQAEGDVQMHVVQSEGNRTCSADVADVDLIRDIFIFLGHARIQQDGKGSVAGDRIIFDRRQNHLKIEGNTLPIDKGKQEETKPSLPQSSGAFDMKLSPAETTTAQIRPTIRLEASAAMPIRSSEPKADTLLIDEGKRERTNPSLPQSLDTFAKSSLTEVAAAPQRPDVNAPSLSSGNAL
jgi:lipopolysaccharide export system protein LptA